MSDENLCPLCIDKPIDTTLPCCNKKICTYCFFNIVKILETPRICPYCRQDPLEKVLKESKNHVTVQCYLWKKSEIIHVTPKSTPRDILVEVGKTSGWNIFDESPTRTVEYYLVCKDKLIFDIDKSISDLGYYGNDIKMRLIMLKK